VENLFTVTLSNKASRKIKKIPQHYLARIKELLITLRENPIPTTIFDVAKIKGVKDAFRIRIGDIRIIYLCLGKIDMLMFWLLIGENEVMSTALHRSKEY
jgi:mRNA interferase RelE/StbE